MSPAEERSPPPATLNPDEAKVEVAVVVIRFKEPDDIKIPPPVIVSPAPELNPPREAIEIPPAQVEVPTMEEIKVEPAAIV